MTDSPSKPKVQHLGTAGLTQIFDSPEFRKIRDACTVRVIEPRFFPTGKPGHETTVKEWGEVYADATGLRALVFHYQHGNGIAVRSIKRIVANECDYRLPMPNATIASRLNASTTKSTL